MTVARFDELIHQSSRLSIISILSAAEWVDFAFLRDQLELSESALSKHISALEDAGYIVIERPVREHRRRVRARLTAAGSRAFSGHVAALREIVGGGLHGEPRVDVVA